MTSPDTQDTEELKLRAEEICDRHIGKGEWTDRAFAAVMEALNTRPDSPVTVICEALEPFARIGDKLSIKGGWTADDSLELAHGFRSLDKIPVAAFRKAREALARISR